MRRRVPEERVVVSSGSEDKVVTPYRYIGVRDSVLGAHAHPARLGKKV